ncbi:MAG: hypothetical protein WCV93_01395 [Candidatus Shapirobacteria bacterium]
MAGERECVVGDVEKLPWYEKGGVQTCPFKGMIEVRVGMQREQVGGKLCLAIRVEQCPVGRLWK